MDWRAECAAIIPCLNEQATIGSLTQAISRHLPTVIVVDDGSNDNTSATARLAGAEVLAHESTQGKGAALQSGCRRALERGFKWALTLDGDGQHWPGDAPEFFRRAEQTGAALIVGDRLSGGQRMPWVRRTVNRWMSRRLSRMAGRELPDSQCGFRLMKIEVWAALPIHTQHFESESEVLMAFIRARQKVEFVPIRVIYKDEQSKIHPLRDAVRWFRWWREFKKQR